RRGYAPLPEAIRVHAPQRNGSAAFAGDDLNTLGVGQEGANHEAAIRIRMGTEHREGITVLAGDERTDGSGGKAPPTICPPGDDPHRPPGGAPGEKDE